MIDIEEIAVATDVEFTCQILINFKIENPEVRARFVAGGIMHHHFDYLTESDQRELMPSLLDRLNFRKGVAEFKKINNCSLDGNEPLDDKNDSIVISNLIY